MKLLRRRTQTPLKKNRKRETSGLQPEKWHHLSATEQFEQEKSWKFAFFCRKWFDNAKKRHKLLFGLCDSAMNCLGDQGENKFNGRFWKEMVVVVMSKPKKCKKMEKRVFFSHIRFDFAWFVLILYVCFGFLEGKLKFEIGCNNVFYMRIDASANVGAEKRKEELKSK